ncbi:hypothetical protein [Arthrobacter sp. U41]
MGRLGIGADAAFALLYVHSKHTGRHSLPTCRPRRRPPRRCRADYVRP